MVIINTVPHVISGHEDQYEGQWEGGAQFHTPYSYLITSKTLYHSLIFNLFQPSHLALSLFLFVNSCYLSCTSLTLISFTSIGMSCSIVYSFIMPSLPPNSE